MSHGVIVPSMVAGAAVSSVVLVNALRGAHRHGDWNASSTLVFAMGWLYALPLTVVAFTAGLRSEPDVYRDVIPVYPSWYGHASQLGIFLAGVVAVVLTVLRLQRGRVALSPAPLVAVGLWLAIHLAGLRAGGPFVSGRSLALLCCLVAAIVLPRGRGACLGVGAFGVTLAVAGGLLAAIHHDVAFVVPCRGACGGLGFNGVVRNPDLFADMLAATVAFAFLGFRSRARYWFVGYLAAMTLATGSVTGSVAVTVTLVLLLALRPRLDEVRHRTAAAAVVGVTLAATAVTAAWMVTHTWNGAVLSGRPGIWRVAGDLIRQSPWVGHGSDAWARLYTVSLIPFADQRSAHNQWLDVLFAGGLVGAVLFVVMLLAVIGTAREARLAVLVALTAIGMLGVTEPAWLTGEFDVLSYSFAASLLLGPPAAPAVARAVVPALVEPRAVTA